MLRLWKQLRIDATMANASDAERYLDGAKFPAKRDDLVHYAKSKNAPEEVVSMLEALPKGETFENVSEVTDTIEDATLDMGGDTEDDEEEEDESDDEEDMNE